MNIYGIKSLIKIINHQAILNKILNDKTQFFYYNKNVNLRNQYQL